MRNFQGIIFIWIWIYGGDFQICISVPLVMVSSNLSYKMFRIWFYINFTLWFMKLFRQIPTIQMFDHTIACYDNWFNLVVFILIFLVFFGFCTIACYYYLLACLLLFEMRLHFTEPISIKKSRENFSSDALFNCIFH